MQSGNSNAEAVQYMEEKYGEEFEYSAPTDNSITGTHALLVRCQSLPEAVYVEIENYRKANKTFRDNYIAVKYKQETTDFLRECAIAEFEDANIFYSVSRRGLSPDLPPDAGFEQFLKDSDAILMGTIEVKSDDDTYKERTEKLVQRIADSGVHFRFMVAVMPPDEFGIHDIDEIGDMMVFGETKDHASIKYTDEAPEVIWQGE